MLTEAYDWATKPSIFSLEIHTRDNLIHQTGKYYFNISTNYNHCINVEQFECTKASDNWQSPTLFCVDCMTIEHPCRTYHTKHHKIVSERDIQNEEK